ncbi:MAG TPA: F0F1 ATP synthase subunit A [Candidatus Methanoperedens sp.]|nr:F0F1 ATP synthase subunit A [Candidatus Methanoperedens sp.]
MVEISPDAIIIWKLGQINLNATIIFTWVVMALLVLISWLATRKLAVEPPLSSEQNLLETIVAYMRSQIHEITQQDPDRYLLFSGTLFLFISVSNVLAIVPGFYPPTASLSTTAALAICVFFAVPIYGIAEHGTSAYIKRYMQPTVFMLPFHIIGEVSRTLALAVRLFGNIMSGTMIVAVLISVVPLFLPVLMQVLGLLIGLIQAYIFAVLATVYIASATSKQQGKEQSDQHKRGI